MRLVANIKGFKILTSYSTSTQSSIVRKSCVRSYKFSLIKELILYIGLGLIFSKVFMASYRLHNIFNNIINLTNSAFLPYKVKFGFITCTN